MNLQDVSNAAYIYSTPSSPLVSFLQLIWIHPLLSVGKDHFQTTPETNYVTHNKSIQFFIPIEHSILYIWNYY